MNWNDNNKLFDLYNDIIREEITDFPYICPVCSEKSAHIYFYRFNDADNKGGLWIWCSKCKSYIHSFGKVPDWWHNCDKIELDCLAHTPDYLEKNKHLLDKWIEKL